MTSVDELLNEAAQGTSLVLTCRGIQRLESSDNQHLALGGEILPSTEEFGHASAWIDTGALYEELVADRGSADFIFCLDPWAAQLLSRANEAAPEAKWILVSDLDQREGAYWQDLEHWYKSLPWTAVISRKLWDQALERRKNPEAAALHAQQQGAWQWKTIAPPAPERAVVFQVRYSGSFPHLKLFLESLARQQGRIRCRILACDPSEDLRRYLRWHAIAHPRIELEIADGPLDGVLELDDHLILPVGRPLSPVATLNPEVTAQILTGNLDAFGHYEKLAGGAATIRLGDLP